MRKLNDGEKAILAFVCMMLLCMMLTSCSRCNYQEVARSRTTMTARIDSTSSFKYGAFTIYVAHLDNGIRWFYWNKQYKAGDSLKSVPFKRMMR